MSEHRIYTTEPVWQHRELIVDDAGSVAMDDMEVGGFVDRESHNIVYECECGATFGSESDAITHLKTEVDPDE